MVTIMQLQIPLMYNDSFLSLQHNWYECVGSMRLEECGNMDDDSRKKSTVHSLTVL
jgi:hypothetical protein